ncbi:MAG: nuclear transport factor 2 family protein, partial [Acidimicrobiia bacterium]|nr:nuclear transport factor 2 family protein [Acidimicrobiia bacterium]
PTMPSPEDTQPAAPATVVRRFFELMEERDWDGAGELLAADVRIDFSATGERFDGPNFLAMNRAYPEGWRIDVIDVIADGNRVAAQVIVDHGDRRFWCAGFYAVDTGRIRSGIEHWVTEAADDPPAWRDRYTTGR